MAVLPSKKNFYMKINYNVLGSVILPLLILTSSCKEDPLVEVATPVNETKSKTLEDVKISNVKKFLSDVLNVPIQDIEYDKNHDEFKLSGTLKIAGSEAIRRYDEANVYKLNLKN